MTTFKETRGGMILESRVEYGKAARRNRGNYSGQKVHKIRAEYCVGIEPGCESIFRPGSVGAAFLKSGIPVLSSAYPVCGCTQGQHAAVPFASLSAEDVTCEKCKQRA